MKHSTLLLIFYLFSISLCAQEKIPIRLEKSGIYTIPCEVNGLKLRFVFDTGASEVHLSLLDAAFMLKNGYLSEDDFIGTGSYELADGSISENALVNIREIKIGNLCLNNVVAAISSNTNASLLLGQSAIQKMGKYTFDGNYLIIHNSNSSSSSIFNTEDKRENERELKDNTILGNERRVQINVNGVKFNMIYVEKGSFTMGAISDDNYDHREHPSHKVHLTRSYYIGETEVTQALWESVMGNNPSVHKGNNMPADRISWNDCQSFISKLNKLTGKSFRLPTEAEWEYAAKGGNKSKGYIYSGSNNLDDVGWYIVNSGDKIGEDNHFDAIFKPENNYQTHEVKKKKPNELGIYDMSGNVSEWCEDGYSDYQSDTQYDPKGISSKDTKVEKGGSYSSKSRHCKNTFRVGFESKHNLCGFRLVMDE